MEGEGSPVIDIVGDTSKALLPEASMTSSSSDASSGGATSDVAKAGAEDAMDSHELAQSYDLGEEIVLEPIDDEAIVFELFFVVGLRMPPHPALAKILLKFWVHLHQLTPNAIAQLFKYFWAMLSFGGESSSDRFAQRYELHYQLKKVVVEDFEKFQQFLVINFHAKQGSEVGLTPAIKNKWSAGWMKA
jgi:hypothetical protein